MSRSISPNQRLLLLSAFLVFWLAVICVRLFSLQVIHYGEFVQRAAHQQQRSIEVSPFRGNIYDRNGNALAMSISLDSIFAVPSEISDEHSVAGILGKILKIDPTEIENRMAASRAFAWVARKVDNDLSSRVRDLNLKGIYFQKEPKRFYPAQELAAQVLGYVGLDDKGLFGVEREFDSRLKGKPGTMLISMDAKRRWFGRVEKNPDPGENVVLTIDEKVQYIAEHELEQAMKDTQAAAGAVIVLNPRSGEVLALANRPTFNPNSVTANDAKALENPAVSNIYEPGSTFKVVTLSAVLEEKLANLDETIDCQMGSIMVNGLRIHDHHPYGLLTVPQILEHSSDVGAIKLALRLGEDRFDRYIRAFGFGSQTGIELPHETGGLAKPVTRWSKVSIGAISMGQEIGVSPVQLISMINTIANDGNYAPPRIIMGTTAPRGTPQLVGFHAAPNRRVISSLTAAEMRQIMEGVVLRGTGTRAILNGYSTAGKTGTAQKIDPHTGAYSHSDYVASFTGFAPVNNPALTVLVVLDSPRGPHEGGEVAAPVFARVAQQVLAYWNAPHDRDLEDPKRLQLRAKLRPKNEDVADAAPDRITPDAEPTAVSPLTPTAEVKTVSANGSCGLASPACAKTQRAPAPTSSAPSAGSPASAPANSTVVLDVAGGVEVPDFTGKSLRAALEAAQEAGVELAASGSGLAESQSPPAGSHVPHGGQVNVRFGR